MDKNNGESDKSLAPRSDAHMKLSDYIARRESVKLVREQQEDEKRQYRDLLHKQEKEFEQYREAFRSETLEREAKFQVEREAREARYVERERGLRARQSEIEILATQRQNELDALRVHLKEEGGKKAEALEQAELALKQEKERYNEENRARLERTSKNYVADALEVLRIKEQQFHTISKLWSVTGAGALALGLGFFAYITLSSLVTLQGVITWELIVFTMLKGLVAVGLLGALSRYAFLFSNSYIRESLKNADRRHAITFGKFYLESYGAAADWTQVKEAFEHWNISVPNAFSRNEKTQIDIASVDQAASVLERVSKMLPKLKSEGAS